MKIRHLLVPAAVALLLVASQAMAVDGATPTQPDARIIAVLVQVDNRGKVTNVDPAVALQPALSNLLRQTLDQMISKPAVDAHGKPIASQMVMQLSMQATQLADGSYNAKFGYVSAKPVPSGTWAWGHVHNGEKPVLVRQDDLANNSLEAREKMAQGIQRAEQQALQRTQQSNSGQSKPGSGSGSGNGH